MSPAIAGLVSVFLLILANVITGEESYRAINWATALLVGAMMPLSTAMIRSGAARLVADVLVMLNGGAGPFIFLFGRFILTAGLGQIM